MGHSEKVKSQNTSMAHIRDEKNAFVTDTEQVRGNDENICAKKLENFGNA